MRILLDTHAWLLDGRAALDVTHQHALRAGTLPAHHRDPFDRMLIAQAQLERLHIMTTDIAFAKHDVEVVAC